MFKRAVAKFALVALVTSGAGIAYGVSSAPADPKKCNPNENGEANSDHGEQGNDDKPCPTAAPAAPTAAPAAAPAGGAAAAETPAVTAARPVTAQPRVTG